MTMSLHLRIYRKNIGLVNKLIISDFDSMTRPVRVRVTLDFDCNI
jgi:hypothetical protein